MESPSVYRPLGEDKIRFFKLDDQCDGGDQILSGSLVEFYVHRTDNSVGLNLNNALRATGLGLRKFRDLCSNAATGDGGGFDALSYAWGDQSRTYSLELTLREKLYQSFKGGELTKNGQVLAHTQIDIHSNLHSFLKRVCRNRNTRYRLNLHKSIKSGGKG